MRRMATGLAASALALASAGCSHEYHPEYHPVQNITYSRVYNVPGSGANAVIVLPPVPGDERGCAMGRAAACYSECFHGGRGWSCELLSVMFRTGEGVFPDAKTAANLHERACALGQCSGAVVATPAPGVVTSPGSVVVYGDMNGNVVLGPAR